MCRARDWTAREGNLPAPPDSQCCLSAKAVKGLALVVGTVVAQHRPERFDAAPCEGEDGVTVAFA